MITSSSPHAPEEYAKRRILVVDDEVELSMALCLILEEGGYETEAAKSGFEGLRAFHAKNYDLVITDGVMPGLDGENMARLMKDVKPAVPIILLTGVPQKFNNRAHFVAVVSKPFRRLDLLAVIDRVLATPSSSAAPC